MATTPRNKVAIYTVAGLLDLAAAWLLVYVLMELSTPSGADLAGIAGMSAVLVHVIVFLLLMVLAVGQTSRAIVGDREAGTLDALVLTPLGRRELVWAKFLGRTRPLRRFMLASAPAYVICYLAVGLGLVADSMGSEHADPAFLYDLLGFGMLALAGIIVGWFLILAQIHCMAAVSLYISARARSSLTAGLWAYGVVVLAAFCIGLPAVVALFILGPILLRDLVRNFDKYVLTD